MPLSLDKPPVRTPVRTHAHPIEYVIIAAMIVVTACTAMAFMHPIDNHSTTAGLVWNGKHVTTH